MKTTLHCLAMAICLLLVQTVSAQDVITLKTGEDVNAKVLKVGADDVEYKKADNPDGPSYTVLKAEVFMIKYQNGSKDVFNTTTTEQKTNVEEIKADNSAEKQLWQERYDYNMAKYRKRLGSGIACTAIGVPFVVTGAALVGVGVNYLAVYDSPAYYNSDIDYEERGWIMLASGAVLLISGVPLTIAGPIKIGTSFKYKRKANDAKANLSFIPSVEPANAIYGSQMGMAMRITF